MIYFFIFNIIFHRNYWKLQNVANGTSISTNKIRYSSSLGFLSLFRCGATTSSSNNTINIEGNLFISLVSPVDSAITTDNKIAIRTQYTVPFQFTIQSQLQLLAGMSVQNGAQITVLFLGEQNGKFFLRIASVSNVLGTYFGDVSITSSNSNFRLVRTSPQFQVQSPFCVAPNTPQSSGCCVVSSPCQQIWEFESASLKRQDLQLNGDFIFSWELYQNYNSIKKFISSSLNINYVLFDTIYRTISIPIKLLFFDSKESALANVGSSTSFSTGDRIFIFPSLDAVERSQFNISVTTIYICYLPNNATLLTKEEVQNNNWGCLDPKVLEDFRVTLVSDGKVKTGYSLATLFNANIDNDIYAGVYFDAIPLSVQAYQQYYVHAIYSLTFSNGTVAKRQVISKQSATSTTTNPGTGLDFFTLSGSASKNNTLSSGAIAGITVASFFLVFIIIFIVLFVRYTKKKYHHLNDTVNGI